MSRTRAAAFVFASSLVGATGWAQVTERVSVASGGAQGNADSSSASISGDGRYVIFHSNASNLVAGDTNGTHDVFVRDRVTGTTERVSVAAGGTQSSAHSYAGSISPDGRYVTFDSHDGGLVPGDTNGLFDVFVHDRLSGTTERVSVSSAGAQGNAESYVSAISADGRLVAFASTASNLVAGDANTWSDIFVRDRLSGTTERVNVSMTGGDADFGSYEPAISADGRFVAFRSGASNLVPGDSNSADDIFVRDLQNGTTERVSVSSAGLQGNLGSGLPSLSADGRYVAFESGASNLAAGDTNGWEDIFVRDRSSGTTVRVSLSTGGAQGNLYSTEPSISADGRYVAFYSDASNLVAGDTNGWWDVFVHDSKAGTTERVSVASSGAEANHGCYYPALSADGRYVAFESGASNLVAGDTGLLYDIFVHDRAASGFTSLCEPGAADVIACPCSNPPSAPGRGCDNSAATGGASLSAAGVAYLSRDSLVFTTSGQPPAALSVLVQGDAIGSSGALFGHGVLCTGGSIRRLYTKTASGGSISAPDLGAGDATVSARSAARGDLLQPGQTRWYFVAYRDVGVLAGCPTASPLNVTQAGMVTWWP